MMTKTKSRSDYFKTYNQKVKVKSVRIQPELLEKVIKSCHTTNKSFNEVVIQLIDNEFNPSADKRSCHTTTTTVVIQQLHEIITDLYAFFTDQLAEGHIDPNSIIENEDLFVKTKVIIDDNKK